MTDAGATERLKARLGWWLARAVDATAITLVALLVMMLRPAAGNTMPGFGVVAMLIGALLFGVEAYSRARGAFVALCLAIAHRQAEVDRLSRQFREMSLPLEQHFDELPLYLRRVLHDPSSTPEARVFAGSAIGELDTLRARSWVACASRSALLQAALERYFEELMANGLTSPTRHVRPRQASGVSKVGGTAAA